MSGRTTLFGLRRTVAASFEALEAISLELRASLAPHCGQSDLFATELLFREALTNAMLHGCGLDPCRNVRLAIRARCNRVLMVVGDDGRGFNWRRGLAHQAQDHDTGGRGIQIYKAYADRVRFNRRGNQLFLIRHFRQAPEV
jgi:anti-sigma regulatory factor (Ser/Thr protein kinase)